MSLHACADDTLSSRRSPAASISLRSGKVRVKVRVRVRVRVRAIGLGRAIGSGTQG